MSGADRECQGRGITHAYQADRDQGGDAPSFYRRSDTLWQGWDKAMSDRENAGARKYRKKEAQGRALDKEVHRTPVSRLEIDRLKAERARANARAALTPPGPIASQTQSAADATRERKIHFQQKRLGSHKHVARDDFQRNKTLEAALALREDLLKERATLKTHEQSRKRAEGMALRGDGSGADRELTQTERGVKKQERRIRNRVRSYEREHGRF